MERILRSKSEPFKYAYNSMGQFLWSGLQQLDGQSVCLIDASTDEHLTVSELKSRANSIAMALIERGINKTDKIAFCGQKSIQHLILRFVAYFLGNTFAIGFKSSLKPEDVERLMKTIGANIIMCSANDFHLMNTFIANNKHSIKHTVVFDGKHDNSLSYGQLLDEGKGRTLDRIPYFDVTKEDIAYITQTTGSTGIPKTALLSHRFLLNGPNRLGLIRPSPDKMGIMLSMSVISGSNIITNGVINGNTVILLPDVITVSNNSSDHYRVFAAIKSYGITNLRTYSTFPTILVEAMDANKYDLSSLKYIMPLGGPVPTCAVQALKQHGVHCLQGYGMTEYSNPTLPDTDGAGTVAPGSEIKIVDLTTGETMGAGIDGEIRLRGNNLFSGYLDNDSAYEELFDSEGWLKTGDIGHYDHKERLFLKGRLKNIINVCVDNHSERVFPEEIEDLLMSHKSIAEVVVIGVANRNGYQWPRAYVVVKKGQNISAEDVQQFVSESLSSAKHLRAGVVIVEHIHRINSKIDRKYYKNLVLNETID